MYSSLFIFNHYFVVVSVILAGPCCLPMKKVINYSFVILFFRNDVLGKIVNIFLLFQDQQNT